MTSIQFTVPGVPVGKGRPRVTRYGTYTPQKTKDYEALVRQCWQTQSGQGFAGGIPIFAKFRAFFPIPKSTSKKKAAAMEGTLHLHKPDSDNVAKAILDALNQYAYPDDSAVMIDGVYKYYTNGLPHVEVTIRGGRPGMRWNERTGQEDILNGIWVDSFAGGGGTAVVRANFPERAAMRPTITTMAELLETVTV